MIALGVCVIGAGLFLFGAVMGTTSAASEQKQSTRLCAMGSVTLLVGLFLVAWGVLYAS